MRVHPTGSVGSSSSRADGTWTEYRKGQTTLAIEHTSAYYRGRIRRHSAVRTPDVKRKLVVFCDADDAQETNEMVSPIRGKGRIGQMMFEAGDTLPSFYRGKKISNLSERIKGHFDRCCIVVSAEDVEAMLGHAEAQLRCRKRLGFA